MSRSVAWLLGWPAIAGSLVSAVVGLVRRQPGPLILAAILLVPIALYLSATPRFPWYPALLPVLLAGSAGLVRRARRLAIGITAPVFVFVAYLAIAMLTYSRPE